MAVCSWCATLAGWGTPLALGPGADVCVRIHDTKGSLHDQCSSPCALYSAWADRAPSWRPQRAGHDVHTIVMEPGAATGSSPSGPAFS